MKKLDIIAVCVVVVIAIYFAPTSDQKDSRKTNLAKIEAELRDKWHANPIAMEIFPTNGGYAEGGESVHGRWFVQWMDKDQPEYTGSAYLDSSFHVISQPMYAGNR